MDQEKPKRKKKKNLLPRTKSASTIYQKKRKYIGLRGEWLAFLGKMEQRGTIFIWGSSGNGKSELAMQMLRYFSQFGKILYNSLEEGDSDTFAQRCQRYNMETARKNFQQTKDNFETLKKRLEISRGYRFVVIDSVQYFGINYRQYIELKEAFPNIVFIYLSHATGKKPKGATADNIMFDADIKIHVIAYAAYAVSRYKTTKKRHIIWQEEYDKIEGNIQV